MENNYADQLRKIKLEIMKWNNILGLVLLFFAGIILCACKDDDATPAPQVTIVDFDLAINENPASGFVLGTATASTDRGELEYRIDQQMPAGAIAIDAASGELIVTDAALFDFEVNQTLTAVLSVAVQDITETANLIITLTDVTETINATDFNLTIDENPSSGFVLGTVIAIADGSDPLTYSMMPTTTIPFAIDETSGQLTVEYAAEFNYELSTVVIADYKVTNGTITEQGTINITLIDVDESITSQPFTATMAENPSRGNLTGNASLLLSTNLTN